MRLALAVAVTATLTMACSDSSRPPLNVAPTIGGLADISIEANTSSSPVSVTLSDDVTANDALGFMVTSDNDLLLPDGSLVTTIATGGRSLTITPAPGVLGVATLTLTVTDERGASDSTMFALTVTPQSVAFDTVLRSVFDDDANDDPRELGSLDIQQGDDNADFSDLL